MGKRSKRKGKAGEREACRVLTELTGEVWIRPGLQSRAGGGSNAPDVFCNRIPQVHWEVKRAKQISLWAALRQAVDDAGERGLIPAVLGRRDREPWVVTVRLEDFPALARALGVV